jgi:hypothetical protein
MLMTGRLVLAGTGSMTSERIAKIEKKKERKVINGPLF